MKFVGQLQFARSDQHVWILGPYNPANHKAYKLHNGTLDATKTSQGQKPWKFAATPATDEMIVGLFGERSPLACALLKDSDISKGEARWRIGGYLLAATEGRDRGVKIPTGVRLEQGSWLPSGGSMQYPTIEDDGVVLSVVVRREFAERHGLEIIAEDASSQPAEISPLTRASNEDLLAECRRRGLTMPT